MPRLPTDGIFAVDGCARKGPVHRRGESVSWQWKDDRGHWRPYSLVDSRIIEVMDSSFNSCINCMLVVIFLIAVTSSFHRIDRHYIKKYAVKIFFVADSI